MTGNTPAVLVSSTFYDLRQIRADLAQFIEHDLGYRALLFEHSSFPIDPDADTIENCRRRVEQDADILVLVVGGRYGSTDRDTAKSVTNLEYLAARAKGIPIYAFVEKRVLAILPTWLANKSADFSRDVDTTSLFEFVDALRSKDRIWVKEFETAQDIVTVLRTQLAYLQREGLQMRLKLRQSEAADIAMGLTGKAFRLVTERPSLWEYRLFAQVAADEIAASSDLRRAHAMDIAFGAGPEVPFDQFGRWIQGKLDELNRTVQQISNLIDTKLQEAFGPPGESGDASDIVFIARKVGDFYRHTIEWSQCLKRAYVDKRCRPVLTELAKITGALIDEIEQFGPRGLKTIDDALNAPPSDEPRRVTLNINFKLVNIDEFGAAMDQALRDLGLCYDS